MQAKKTNTENEEKVIVYLLIMEFQGYQVPLQIFERYNLSKSLKSQVALLCLLATRILV